jgi:hypothetical protein
LEFSFLAPIGFGEARGFIPDGVENEEQESDESDRESDEEKDVLDVMKERRFGTRKSDRKRKETKERGPVKSVLFKTEAKILKPTGWTNCYTIRHSRSRLSKNFGNRGLDLLFDE